jgi:hypothetical protein
MSYNINFSGPLFNGVAVAELATAEAAVQKEIAEYAEYQWQMNMHDSFQHPTGHYQSHVNTIRRGSDLVVNDGWPGSGLAYGPWLEGIGSRNKTTRFKGYFAMRRAANSVAQRTQAIAKPVIDKFIVVANGV